MASGSSNAERSCGDQSRRFPGIPRQPSEPLFAQLRTLMAELIREHGSLADPFQGRRCSATQDGLTDMRKLGAENPLAAARACTGMPSSFACCAVQRIKTSQWTSSVPGAHCTSTPCFSAFRTLFLISERKALDHSLLNPSRSETTWASWRMRVCAGIADQAALVTEPGLTTSRAAQEVIQDHRDVLRNHLSGPDRPIQPPPHRHRPCCSPPQRGCSRPKLEETIRSSSSVSCNRLTFQSHPSGSRHQATQEGGRWSLLPWLPIPQSTHCGERDSRPEPTSPATGSSPRQASLIAAKCHEQVGRRMRPPS